MTVVVRDSTARTLKPVIYTVLNTLTVFQFDGRYTVSQAGISFTDKFYGALMAHSNRGKCA